MRFSCLLRTLNKDVLLNVHRSKNAAATLSVLGNGSLYSPPCISLEHQNKCFWFNSTDSGVLNHKIILQNRNKNLYGLFLTSLQWQRSIEGLMTLFMSYKESLQNSQNEITVVGPTGTKELLIKYIYFLTSQYSRQWLDQINFMDITLKQLYSKNDLHIHMIPINNEDDPNDITTIAYVGCFTDGISRDNMIPYYNKMLFHPKFMNEIGPRPFVILECPTLGHLKSLMKQDIFNKQIDSVFVGSPVVISHITPPDVFNSNGYQSWIRSRGTECYHLVLNETNSPGIINHITHKYQLKLHKTCDYFFSCPQVIEDDTVFINKCDSKIIKSPCLLKGVIHNNNALEWDASLVFSGKEILKEVEEDMENLYDSDKIQLKLLQKNFKECQKESDKEKYPLVLNIGSGSSEPCYYRSNSTHLVFLSPDSSILLDCGAATLQRIYQHYGHETEAVLKSIKCIFISHLHPDHHIGFVSLIKAIDKIRSENHKVVCLMCSDTYHQYLEDYEPTLLKGLIMLNIHKELLNKDIINFIGLKHMQICPVHHTLPTMGIVLIDKSGFKISYTSDTRPSPKYFIQPAKQSDLLIHDCGNAIEEIPSDKKYVSKGHSNFDGSLKTQQATKSKFLLLTHFQNPIPVIPICDKSIKMTNFTCFAAFDHLAVFSNKYNLLPTIYEMLYIVFKRSQLTRLVEHRRRKKSSD